MANTEQAQVRAIGFDQLADRPVLAKALQELPKVSLSDNFVLPVGGPWQGNQCAVCIEEYKEGDLIALFPCAHFLHQDCAQATFSSLPPLCPICRAGIFDEATAEDVRQEHRDILGEEMGSEFDQEFDDEDDFVFLMADHHDVTDLRLELVRRFAVHAEDAVEARDAASARDIFQLIERASEAAGDMWSLCFDVSESGQDRLDAINEAVLACDERFFWSPFQGDLYLALCWISARRGVEFPDATEPPKWPIDPSILEGYAESEDSGSDGSYGNNSDSDTEMDDASDGGSIDQCPEGSDAEESEEDPEDNSDGEEEDGVEDIKCVLRDVDEHEAGDSDDEISEDEYTQDNGSGRYDEERGHNASVDECLGVPRQCLCQSTDNTTNLLREVLCYVLDFLTFNFTAFALKTTSESMRKLHCHDISHFCDTPQSHLQYLSISPLQEHRDKQRSRNGE